MLQDPDMNVNRFKSPKDLCIELILVIEIRDSKEGKTERGGKE